MDTIFLSGLTTECIIGIWDWERKVKQKVVVDLRNVYDPTRMASLGFRYTSVGRAEDLRKRAQ